MHDNTLARPLRDYGPDDRVDMVLTNPPSAGRRRTASRTTSPRQYHTRETADLFLALIMHLLRTAGARRSCYPTGSSSARASRRGSRRSCSATCDLHTVVRLPNGVFAPYTGINTNLLFFTKGTPTKEVWYYEHPLPEGYKNYTKTRPIRIEEFEREKAWWDDREENEYAWKVPVKEIGLADTTSTSRTRTRRTRTTAIRRNCWRSTGDCRTRSQTPVVH